MKKIAKTVNSNKIYSAVPEIRNILTSSEVEELNSFLIVIDEGESNNNFIQEKDYLNKNVLYILELLYYT